MADIKATSFRINEEDIAKFKEFADKEGYNQAEAFKSIMQSFEMAQAKGIIKDRAKEIGTFQDTINKLMGYYLNSLEVNQNSEERIREELALQLDTKDKTINNLQSDIENVRNAKSEVDDLFGRAQKTLKEKLTENIEIKEDIKNKQTTIDKLNSNNDLLQEQLQEYKQYKDDYKLLEKELEQLKADNSTNVNTISSLENNNKQLKDKIANDAEMIDFYKSNNEELKDNIKVLEQQHKQELQAVKADNEKVLEKELKAISDQLQSKHDVEIAKKDLDLQKLQNEIEQLKAKSHRPVKNNTTK